jgi:hypothetical protein
MPSQPSWAEADKWSALCSIEAIESKFLRLEESEIAWDVGRPDQIGRLAPKKLGDIAMKWRAGLQDSGRGDRSPNTEINPGRNYSTGYWPPDFQPTCFGGLSPAGPYD